MTKWKYTPPKAEPLSCLGLEMLASSTDFNYDNGTEYFDYEDGGLI